MYLAPQVRLKVQVDRGASAGRADREVQEALVVHLLLQRSLHLSDLKRLVNNLLDLLVLKSKVFMLGTRKFFTCKQVSMAASTVGHVWFFYNQFVIEIVRFTKCSLSQDNILILQF